MENGQDSKKKESLRQIYACYDETIKCVDTACKEKCAACCTCNVTMTRLEAHYLIDSMDSSEQKRIAEKVVSGFPVKRFIPRMSTNMFARFCMEGRTLPDEENDPLWGSCPLLVNGSCSIYDVRPFGCRALISTVSCEKQGYADVSELVLTIQNLFLQAIEHLDSNGTFGNLSDMLAVVLSDRCLTGAGAFPADSGKNQLLSNEKISVLMVPPEHRSKVAKVMQTLSVLTS